MKNKILFTLLFCVNIFSKNIINFINCSDQQVFINKKLINIKQNALATFKKPIILPYLNTSITASYLLLNKHIKNLPEQSLKLRVGSSEEFGLWYNEQGIYCLNKETQLNRYNLKKLFNFSHNLSLEERLKFVKIMKLILTVQSISNKTQDQDRLKISLI